MSSTPCVWRQGEAPRLADLLPQVRQQPAHPVPWPWRPPGVAWDRLEPDGIHPSGVHHAPDREVRWRRYDAQVVEIVVDLIGDTIVSAWITRVEA